MPYDSKLRDLCYRAASDDEDLRLAGLKDIEQWIEENKYNQGHLRKSANYQDYFRDTPIHYVVRANPPTELVERLLQLAPDTAKVQDNGGNLPLHYACMYRASSDVIKIIFESYPKAA